MLRLLTLALTILVVYWTFLFFVQRTLTFPRPDLASAPPRPDDAEVVWLEQPAGRTEAWLLPARSGAPGPAPVLLFAHGNAELIDHWAGEFDEPRSWGLAVLLVEYPGYGRSAGHPAQSTIAATMAAAHAWIATEPSLDTARIIAYGRSLGGGAVSTLLPDRPPAALILESTFTDTRRFARNMGAPASSCATRSTTWLRSARTTVRCCSCTASTTTSSPSNTARPSRPRLEWSCIGCRAGTTTVRGRGGRFGGFCGSMCSSRLAPERRTLGPPPTHAP